MFCVHVRAVMCRRSVQKLEEDLKQLKAQQALTLERTEVQHLQNQVRQEGHLGGGQSTTGIHRVIK